MGIIFFICINRGMQVCSFVKLKELYYAGSHGMDIKGPPRSSSNGNKVSSVSSHCIEPQLLNSKTIPGSAIPITVQKILHALFFWPRFSSFHRSSGRRISSLPTRERIPAHDQRGESLSLFNHNIREANETCRPKVARWLSFLISFIPLFFLSRSTRPCCRAPSRSREPGWRTTNFVCPYTSEALTRR